MHVRHYVGRYAFFMSFVCDDICGDHCGDGISGNEVDQSNAVVLVDSARRNIQSWRYTSKRAVAFKALEQNNSWYRSQNMGMRCGYRKDRSQLGSRPRRDLCASETIHPDASGGRIFVA